MPEKQESIRVISGINVLTNNQVRLRLVYFWLVLTFQGQFRVIGGCGGCRSGPCLKVLPTTPTWKTPCLNGTCFVFFDDNDRKIPLASYCIRDGLRS